MADHNLRRIVLMVGLVNLGYFFIEFSVARVIGSVSLFADSVDFLEDASVNFLILIALGWTIRARARVGMILAALLLCPAIATLYMVWHKFTSPFPPEPIILSVTGAGALMVNLGCAYLLAQFRDTKGSLTKAAFLSARNDALANIGIIIAGILTYVLSSAWPDIIIGLAIAAINIDAAKEVWTAARKEGLELIA